ncbi:RagB/SusD family nutrient uptake outer membrane protein [Sinomicrobium pectinilyticum]|uniref:RagB/SusD family nutrient uptake outer membrane protein n=1 Tax=Sinomicrobium pectinilyticum TaxID=1084421 RepID=A0A3N0E3G3_SINP1|nr:RagB/SusD family nutrient uptake outer membrane protein [Sinomicrobium pectinilyticum]RNL82385.1 RagB/SusD family nutrient uptake outer membrane protein [Sinomicrobium pectinilyticum]
MKKNIVYISAFLILLGLFSCGKDLLEESPRDFLSTENAFTSTEDIDASVYNLYRRVRREFYDRDENRPFDYLYGTDLVFDGEPQQSSNRHSPMKTAYDPTGAIATDHWGQFYKIISEANTIIDRLALSEITSEEQETYKSKALFFRGLSYRSLAYLYGGVPVSLNEISTPKTDFTRASRSEVIAQAISDLEVAADHLPGIADVLDGEINNLAAYHLLAELYIANGEFQKAIDAATIVIDDPSTALMQNRFGSRQSETDKDVYWDLFRNGNQNRSSGNTEGIWVIQFQTDVPGGSLVSSGLSGYVLERHHGPFFRDLKINGENPFAWPVGDLTGGRGIGWMISTTYFSNTIWESDFDNDIRNANHNFAREFVANNPGSSFFGQTISTEDPELADRVPSRNFYAFQTKCTTPFNHPGNIYDTNSPIPFMLKSSAGSTYTDQYMFRLAETYLLRAEAYLGLGNTGKAADDINIVRQRANASLVNAGDVDIDYILDERMRELGVEEKRRLTLMRLGKLYDRVKAHNPFYTNQADGLEEHYNLWPIPFSEIEANIGADIEQNPGYN